MVCMLNINEFRFNSGRLALDLPATVRRRASEPRDVLAPEGASARWLRAAGLSAELLVLNVDQTTRLSQLREAIWKVADAVAAERKMPTAAVDTLNTMAALPLAVPKLDAGSGTVELIADDSFQTALATIARDAIDLFGDPLRTRIKACEQPDCRMLFLDTSRSSRRRWCSMDRCGSRAKGAAFRTRNRQHPHEH
ncbi:hypothetical protein ATN00_21680 (plasmid) [Sphingobium baderi]|uniref:Zinc finger CGNR domain-containing protein n=2 Tax=Sphingobium baderi TaxID=1332080 RepID=A0A0S3F614_9SPHN|nr:hypothetical protein ATN00_21680 [Sphingobium baderi]